MFSQPTELEITLNTYPASYGAAVVLSARAYQEILQAARMYDAIRSGAGSAAGGYIPTNPIPIQHG